jgi:hypothetical protein
MKVGSVFILSVGESLHAERKQELNDGLFNVAFGSKMFWVYAFPGNK